MFSLTLVTFHLLLKMISVIVVSHLVFIALHSSLMMLSVFSCVCWSLV